MRDADPTAEESTFFAELAARLPEIQDWYHQDDDGTLWMTVSYDFTQDNRIYQTLRLDYDGKGLRGGWSPSCLNGDDGVRADAAMIATAGPAGLRLDCVDPTTDAAAAAAWFRRHIDRWPAHPR
ncbi:hypothetical protein [Micromonospora auratinigra]|uniref:Uncharacterized protein n=1 Tax=Micromonospora auratinigra TaxID=261654 RepID=A0A1A8Z0L6_9ACTN|nr:hypothetical protein [Micromonospora auratinigra]SBT37263.1 hypothetical protein GA0070611_0142 [Micromonospora auratinigra]